MSKAEFQKLHEEMHALRSSGNADDFANKFLTKDAVFISPLHEPVGVKEILLVLKSGKLDALKDIQQKIQVDEVIQHGDMAVDRSTVTIQVLGEEKISWNLTVWVKEDGGWKVRQSSTTFKSPLAK